VRTRVPVAVALVLAVMAVPSAPRGTVGATPLRSERPADRLKPEDDPTSVRLTARLGSFQAATSRGNNSRDGWYPNEPGLSPKIVGSSQFGELFVARLNGQIYAQPLLVGGVVFVATETDWIYGLNPVTGAVEWSRRIGTSFQDAPLHCGDLTPNLGVTSTPTVDPETGVVYLVDQAYVAGHIGWFMHAIDPVNGAEMPNFPVEIEGPATNNPLQLFRPTKELQRPGLLFLNGVVYAAFGSHCDYPAYAGFVVGVSTAGRQTTLWTTQGAGSGSGGGIWQGGGGLVSDGPGQILFSDGNGENDNAAHPNGTIPGHSPPANLADSVVRLVVQPDGSLKATDFFSMYDDYSVDGHDWDLAGAPIALPSEFSTPGYPHLLVVSGKEGIVYLLNRDNLGGIREGPGKKDLVVGEYGPNGEVIGTAGAWPGNGGYVYVATVSGARLGASGEVDVYKFTTTGKGVPRLSLVAIGSQPAVFGVSGPLVTSNGTNSGSAVVWVVDGAHLQAYDAVPVNKELRLIGTWFVGNTDPFNPPGIGDNVVYVSNQAGLLYGFGKKR